VSTTSHRPLAGGYLTVSEFSFALSKHLYSHTETPLRKAIHRLTFTEEDRQAFKKHFGYVPKIDYKKKEGGYWQFVNMVFLIIVIPYSIAIFRVYYLRPEKVFRRNK
jgi:hypothetical protein